MSTLVLRWTLFWFARTRLQHVPWTAVLRFALPVTRDPLFGAAAAPGLGYPVGYTARSPVLKQLPRDLMLNAASLLHLQRIAMERMKAVLYSILKNRL